MEGFEKVKKGLKLTAIAGLVGIGAQETLANNASTSPHMDYTDSHTNVAILNTRFDPKAGPRNIKFEGSEGEGPNPPESEKVGDPVTLNVSAYFKTNTVEYVNAQARIEAKNAIRTFLKNVDLKTSKITVIGSSSKERPTKRNAELARTRAEEGLRLVQEVINEDYPGMNIVIETIVQSDASIYEGLSAEEIQKINRLSPEEFERLIDGKQGISINAEARTKVPEKLKKVPDTTPDTPIILADFGAVFIDESASMKNDVDAVLKEIKEVKKTGITIKTITLEGGNLEKHLATLENFLLGLSRTKTSPLLKVLVLTDEPDNALGKKMYEDYVGRVIGLAIMNNVEITIKVFNPNRSAGGEKVFKLRDKRDGLLQEDSSGKTMSPQEWYDGL